MMAKRMTIRVEDADTARPSYVLLMDYDTALRAYRGGQRAALLAQAVYPTRPDAVAAADRLGRLILRAEEDAR